MSTKTSIKRIALVAVSVLGFGLLSVVPAKAEGAASVTNSISLARITAAPTAGAEVCVNFAANVDDYTNIAADTTHTYVGYLSSYPSGGFAQVEAAVDAGGTDIELWTAGQNNTEVDESVSGSSFIAVIDSDANTDDFTGNTLVTTGTANGVAKYCFTPGVAGTYVLTVFNDAGTLDGAINIGEAVNTISISVVAGAPTGYSNGLSKAWLIDGTIIDGTVEGDEDTDALGAIASKTVSNTPAAAVDISLLNQSGNAAGGALTGTLSASVTGAGFIKWDSTGDDAPDTNGCTSASERSANLTATSSDNVLYICADGTVGDSTVTIYFTEADSTLHKLATKTVTFHGSVASLSIALTNYTVAKAGGGTLGDKTSDRNLSTEIPAVIINGKDSGGRLVGGLTIQRISSNLAVAETDTASACEEDDGYTAANIYTSGGEGYYNCDIDTPTSATSGDTATLTFRVADPASLTGGYLTVELPITIGGSLKSVTMTTDKDVYAPGEEMKLTWVGKDASGNAPYDGQNAIYSLTANKSLGAALPTSRSLLKGTRSNSSLAPVFAPAASGPFTLTFIENTTALTKYTLTKTVSDDAASAAANAASDAAAEAIDAANAATDAANLAAEAADAATVAAEEARDAADAATAAVEALATEVATLMAALKAQITTLANTVAKIAKKVKA